ncbi:TIGR02117 family protein [Phormidesmis priestleyi ULC007]|uniref:TIGR02117 family protein n=2 Tax=Phormidesmis priestleyi TaxID=268141 RepID=A0A2T1DK86_9CYAN|nr:TIGR02117 family protein [Phormidesmis priestleyi ULC007]PZO51864.1 MAG: TIGR02117 family protein [Phormidesmis priestleyi]
MQCDRADRVMAFDSLVMNQSKRHSILFRRTWRYFVAPMLITTTLLGIGYVTPRKWGTSSQSCQNQPFKVYVAGDAMHVNLILPVQNQAFDWSQFLSIDQIGRDAQQRYRYLKFGWGDRDFYMNTPSWSEMKISNVLRSLFMPGNPTALYVEGDAELPHEPNVELKCVGVSQKDYLQLVAFIKASFQQTDQGQPIRIQDAIDTSGFYEATGHYSILRTCNTWAADGLDSANIQTPIWSGLAPAVIRQIPK